jgi:dihydroxyacid dehydratase/phosphogluconate dehydratase
MPDASSPLRSATWFGKADKNGFMYRSWMKNQGISDREFQGKPISGICSTWSELSPCNAHSRQLAERARRRVFEAGGYAVEFPVFSNGGSNLRPTAMFTRNLANMDVDFVTTRTTIGRRLYALGGGIGIEYQQVIKGLVLPAAVFVDVYNARKS